MIYNQVTDLYRFDFYGYCMHNIQIKMICISMQTLILNLITS